MKCKWDKAIGCHTGNNTPPIVEPIAKNKQTPRTKYVYAAKCRGTIELLRRVVNSLNWKFSNLKKCSECKLVPPHEYNYNNIPNNGIF
jgi:hypothetical protein